MVKKILTPEQEAAKKVAHKAAEKKYEANKKAGTVKHHKPKETTPATTTPKGN